MKRTQVFYQTYLLFTHNSANLNHRCLFKLEPPQIGPIQTEADDVIGVIFNHKERFSRSNSPLDMSGRVAPYPRGSQKIIKY